MFVYACQCGMYFIAYVLKLLVAFLLIRITILII